MKNYKNITTDPDPKKWTTIIESITCNLCKKEFDGDNWGKPLGQEDTNYFSKTRLFFDEGCVSDSDTIIDEGKKFGRGFGEKISADICPECFKKKVIPALKEIGVDFQHTNWDGFTNVVKNQNNDSE